MNETKLDFEKRKIEIDNYFSFLKLLDQSPASILYTNQVGTSLTEGIDDDLVKILKANGFIILYNLIESTVVKSIKAIFNKISDENLTYSDLSDSVKKLWINGKGAVLKGVDDVNLNKIRDLLRDVAESILTSEIANLDTSCLSISGNIDAQAIRVIARQVGFDDAPDGRHLLTIKTKRNHLAHGDFSFCDIGKDFSVNELLAFRDNTFDYLGLIMTNVEVYISDRKYNA